MAKSIATRKPKQMSTATRERMDAELARTSSRIEIGGGRMIRTRGRRFTFPDETKINGPLEVVVIDYMAWNTYYDEPWEEDKTVPPVCYAFNEEPSKLAPSENSKEIQGEAGELCKSCHWNEFGSAPNGKGKACQNRRLLAVLPPDASEEDELMVVSVSPSAITKFDSFVSTCRDEYGVTPIGVICEMDFNEAVDYPSLTFRAVAENPDIDFYFNKTTEARAMLTNEPSYESDEDDKPAATPKRKALTKKKVAKKKVTKKKTSARR